MFEALLALQQLARAPARQGDQRGAGEQVQRQQQPHQLAGNAPEGLGEGLLDRRHRDIDRLDAIAQRLQFGRLHPAAGNPRMQGLGDGHQLVQIGIADQPELHRVLELADIVEVAVQPDQAVDVGGMVAALQGAAPRAFEVRLGLVEGEAHHPVAEGNADGVEIAAVVPGVVGDAVALQVVDGVLLALGPEAFAADIGAHGGERIQARAADQPLEKHHQDERPYQPRQVGNTPESVLHDCFHRSHRYSSSPLRPPGTGPPGFSVRSRRVAGILPINTDRRLSPNPQELMHASMVLWPFCPCPAVHRKGPGGGLARVEAICHISAATHCRAWAARERSSRAREGPRSRVRPSGRTLL
ncbi:hypothetical protein D3C76_981900 [compost metagenome]